MFSHGNVLELLHVKLSSTYFSYLEVKVALRID